MQATPHGNEATSTPGPSTLPATENTDDVPLCDLHPLESAVNLLEHECMQIKDYGIVSPSPRCDDRDSDWRLSATLRDGLWGDFKEYNGLSP